MIPSASATSEGGEGEREGEKGRERDEINNTPS